MLPSLVGQASRIWTPLHVPTITKWWFLLFFFFGYKANVESILSTSRAENNNVKSRYLEVEIPFVCAIDVHSLGDVCNEGLRKL
jgi:hypothetical protein